MSQIGLLEKVKRAATPEKKSWKRNEPGQLAIEPAFVDCVRNYLFDQGITPNGNSYLYYILEGHRIFITQDCNALLLEIAKEVGYRKSIYFRCD